MAEIISLSKARKKKERTEKEKRADENRVKFGRRKNDAKMDRRNKKKNDDRIDGHKLED